MRHSIERGALQALIKIAINALEVGRDTDVPDSIGHRWVRRHVVRLHHRTPRRYAVHHLPAVRMIRISRLPDSITQEQ